MTIDRLGKMDLVLLVESAKSPERAGERRRAEYLAELGAVGPVVSLGRLLRRDRRPRRLTRRLIDASARHARRLPRTRPTATPWPRSSTPSKANAISLTEIRPTPSPGRCPRSKWRLAATLPRGIAGVQVGLQRLDGMTSGFQPGDSHHRRPPVNGKTALAINMAEGIAEEGAVIVFSLEMSAEALWDRIVGPPEWTSRSFARARWDASSTDRCSASPTRRRPADRHHRPGGPDDHPGADPRPAERCQAQASRNARAGHHHRPPRFDQPGTGAGESAGRSLGDQPRVKALARELDVPVICLSQLQPRGRVA